MSLELLVADEDDDAPDVLALRLRNRGMDDLRVYHAETSSEAGDKLDERDKGFFDGIIVRLLNGEGRRLLESLEDKGCCREDCYIAWAVPNPEEPGYECVDDIFQRSMAGSQDSYGRIVEGIRSYRD
ncbi:MAG: hypothetical protein ABEJ56_02495 [Candidatus Nanohaloarchaea archaeon]